MSEIPTHAFDSTTFKVLIKYGRFEMPINDNERFKGCNDKRKLLHRDNPIKAVLVIILR